MCWHDMDGSKSDTSENNFCLSVDFTKPNEREHEET